MPVFIVNDTEIECSETDTLLDVKKKIIKELNISSPYIDINFLLDKPMRTLGKFNVEPGKVSRPFDRHTLDKFAFKGPITISYTEVSDHDSSTKKPLMSGGRGRGRGLVGDQSAYVAPSARNVSTFDHSSTEVTMTIEPTFVLDSDADFPTLGS